MTKILRNVFISMFGIFAFLFAGFFFVGCGIDYSKIQLVCDQETIYLDVGESVDLTFTIENYQSGFSNKIDYNDQSSGIAEVFSCSEPKYVTKDQIQVTITGIAGGTGKLEVKTLEAGKTCDVNIFVNQDSNSLNATNDMLYVSNKTPFVPTADIYNFDNNTTNKDLSYYYLHAGHGIDFATFSLVSMSFSALGDYAVFSDGITTLSATVSAFDKAILQHDDENDKELLKILNQDDELVFDAEKTFDFLAIYDLSMKEDGTTNLDRYDNIVYDVSTVNVLPDMKVEISGGYVGDDGEIDFSSVSDTITIVPNNSKMNVFVLKVEMSSKIFDLPYSQKIKKSNNMIDIDYFKDQDYVIYGLEKQDNVYYLKISQNTQTQGKVNFDFEIYYDVAQNISDESVNIERNYLIDIQIAPIAMLANGKTSEELENETTILYNYYELPDYGWVDLVFDVISGLESSPNFEGVYFEYDESQLELELGGVNIASDPSGEGKLYKDLSKTFKVRGAYLCKETEPGNPTELKIHLKSDILEGGRTEISLTIKFDIVPGAKVIGIDGAYSSLSTFCLDMAMATKTMNNVIVADQPFQAITYELCGGANVVDISYNSENPYVKGDGVYYLNLTLSPRMTGVGLYRIYLDNGLWIEVSFTVLKTLDSADEPFVLANLGNEAVTNFGYAKGDFSDGTPLEGVDYNNILNVDIINPNKNGSVEFGASAILNVVANVPSEGIKLNVLDGRIAKSQADTTCHFSTLENGVALIDAQLTGYTVNDFLREDKTLKYEIRIASYSLLQEFYLKSGSDIALESTVYYNPSANNISQSEAFSESKVSFSTQVDNFQTFGFYKYDFTDKALIKAYNSESAVGEGANLIYDYDVVDTDIDYRLNYDYYNDKFVYFYAQTNRSLTSKITAKITKGGEVKRVRINISTGIMFMPEKYRTITTVDEHGATVTYSVEFEDMIFKNEFGEFDIETMTYRTTFQSAYTLKLSAYVRQRNMTRHYDVRIKAEQYQSVESISLASSISKLDFTNDNLVHELGVYTYPQTSTNKNIEVRFVATNGNPYNMLRFEIDKTQSDMGVYTVKLSCEEFFNNSALRGDKDIVEIEESLTGKVYIFPREWGNSIYEIEAGLQPIIIDVQYRNGSKNNPNLLETVEDIQKINENETTLKSHYELNTVIDMTSVTGFTPIGSLTDEDGNILGFSGSIVGSNSQATIANISVSNSNASFVHTDGVLYGGLFAKINEGALIENISFTGKFDLDLDKNAYVGLLTSINYGSITNVGVQIEKSSIEYAQDVVSNTLYFGAVAGINAGSIIQNFDLYDQSGIGYTYQESFDGNGHHNGDFIYQGGIWVETESGTHIKVDDDGNRLPEIRDLVGQSPKILAYFNDFVTIKVDETNVYAGGIAGASSGTIQRKIDVNSTLKLYGYSTYSAYTQINLIGEMYGPESVHVGGAVGIASFNTNTNGPTAKILPISDLTTVDNAVRNLLLGGEIDTTAISAGVDSYDYVGGAVGYLDTLGTSKIYVQQNTSRVFLRASDYVGGIIGFDMWNYALGYGEELAQYASTTPNIEGKTKNTIEAIDDGRGSFYSSLIIKTSPVSGYDSSKKKSLFAVGNVLTNGATYASGDIFDSFSYLARDLISLNTGDEVLVNNSNYKDNYGDYLIVQKNAGKYIFATNCHQLEFEDKAVEIGVDDLYDEYKMKTDDVPDPSAAPDVFFMYYFSVDAYLDHEGVVDTTEIENLNIITPNSVFYPYSLTGGDITITSANTDVLAIDIDGVITVKKPGLAILEMSSIKNINNRQKIYIYVINYFDKNVQASLFYSSKSSSATNLTDESLSIVYGNSKNNVYLVPTYQIDTKNDATGTYLYDEKFAISKTGILNYNNVNYVITKNSQMTIMSQPQDAVGTYFSKYEILKQTISFSKQGVSATENDIDKYLLTPKLEIALKIDDNIYHFVYELETAEINLNVQYREKATQIYTDSDYAAIKSNEYFEDLITVESTNKEEMIFYQIFFDGELVQDRLPTEIGDIDYSEWLDYINFKGSWADNNNTAKFFDLKFEENIDNTFKIRCEINEQSQRFSVDRFNKNIYGEYKIYFYASDLGKDGGVCHAYTVDLGEAEVNYLKAKNYSNIEDVGVEDDKLVPSQRGLLEIAIDPVEAVFKDIVVSNSELNYQTGTTEASLTFVYEKVSSTGVEYVLDPNFGTYKNGSLTFSYDQLIKRIDDLNKEFGATATVSYTGKVFVSYYMPANNVENARPVGFDVKVNYGKDKFKTTVVKLTTKLGNYAKLVFDDKAVSNDVYYVARGLSYNLTLQSYGFTEDEITITSTNSSFAKISGGNGKYILEITPNSIAYNDNPGYLVEIETLGKKVVDDIVITTKDTLKIYIMEYVFDYTYSQGVNEDLVKGMEDGVIYTAVGNPYTLEFDIAKFLEYDASNRVVVEEVNKFVSEMTQKIDWHVYYDDTATKMQPGKAPFRNDYYQVNGLIVTPLKVYSEESDIYYFSLGAYYNIRNGVYEYSAIATENRLYTEFEFDVHDQSTEDSPIPIYTYEEFLNMEDGQWYILLEDIVLPSKESVAGTEKSEFKPLSMTIAGLDGNGKKIKMAGTYNFSGLTKVGLFESVEDSTLLKNITIELTGDTIFNMDENAFEIGLLAAQNNGIITNCVVQKQNNATLSVLSSVSVEKSYVAALVSTNNSYITHSRSNINIFTNANLSGFVAQNGVNGVITSSYFKGGSLKNETNTAELTAGFVIENYGEIYTSYVSGETNAKTMYYDEKPESENIDIRAINIILSSNNITGFVYSNRGSVQDCYSNILLRQSGAFATGFVFQNSGKVNRCFSTSVFENYQSSNYGFARTNYIDNFDNKGQIVDCFYLQDTGINESIGEIQVEKGDTSVDLKALTQKDFLDWTEEFDDDGDGTVDRKVKRGLEEYFSEYVYANGRDTNAVWFYNNDAKSTIGFGGQIFNTGRLELVAPNLIATSERELDRIESIKDEATGATYAQYIYNYKAGSASLGSEGNPIVIYDAESMEEYILQENNKANYNRSHYRLVADIDYNEYLFNSKIYKTRFIGYLEGNFMTVENISFVSSEALNFAGLFAEVGSSVVHDSVGTVMNFDLKPAAVSFSNANVVGGLAGKIDDGKIFNVNVNLVSKERLVVVGRNVVGGAIGVALGDYTIVNLHSELSAKARTQSGDENRFNYLSNDYTSYSFAGSVVGVLSGIGQIHNTYTDTPVAVLANKAGLMFGLIDENAKVTNLDIEVNEDMIVNAYNFGGLIAGESKGKVTDVSIMSNIDGAFKGFRDVPFTANAIGGFAGLVSGGSIQSIYTNQSIEVSEVSESAGFKYLGGLAGLVQNAAEFKNVTIDVDNLTGFQYVGGLAGALAQGANLQVINAKIKAGLRVLGFRIVEVGLGGLVGEAGINSAVTLKTDFSDKEEYRQKLSEKAIKLQMLNEKQIEKTTKENELESLVDETQKRNLQNEINGLKEEIDDLIVEINALKEGCLIYENPFKTTMGIDESEPAKNIIDINVSTIISALNATMSIHVGAIIGADRSGVPHSVYDSRMSIVSNPACESYDYGDSYGVIQSVLQVQETGDELELAENKNGKYEMVIKKLNTATGIDSESYCNVKFVTSELDKSSNVMYISLYGGLYTPA